jgi:hypothetical protein
MANMSYCRFRNTLPDLLDCLESIHDEGISEEETRYKWKLIECCREIVSETSGLRKPKTKGEDLS